MRDKILAMIAEVCEDDIVIEEPDINMAEEELMTSLEYTELLIRLEDEMGVIIAPSEFTKEETNTPEKIVGIVLRKIAEAAE